MHGRELTADYLITAASAWAGEIDFRALAETLPTLVFVTDAAGLNLYTNSSFQRFTGRSANELLGGGWLLVLHPEDRARALEIWTTSLVVEEPYEAQYRFHAADGDYRWHLCRATPVGEDGKVVRWIASCTDIGDLRHGRPDRQPLALVLPAKDDRKSLEGAASFRLALAEALRDASDARTMMDIACDMLGRRLGVAQIGFAEFEESGTHVVVQGDWNDGRIPSISGRWRVDDFCPAFVRALGTGETIVIPDVSTDPRTQAGAVPAVYDGLGIRALLDIGLVREGQLRAVLFTHHPEPRDWQPDEIALVEETVERLWSAVERARAEARLRESEERFRGLVEAVSEIIWVSDAEGRLLEPTEPWQAFTGQSAAECLSFGWLDAVHPDDRDGTGRIWQECVTVGAYYKAEYRVRKHDGSWRWVLSRAAPLQGTDGRLRGYVGMSTDITVTYEASVRLAHQAALLDQAHEAIFTWEIGGGIAFWNKGAEQLYGFSAVEVQGRSSHDLLRSLHPVPTHDFESLLEREGSWTGELEHVTKDGRRLVVESCQVLVRGPAGQRLVLETNHDVTARKTAERELQEKQALLDAILSSVDGIVFAKDLEGRYLLTNEAARRVHGRGPEETPGLTDYDLFPADVADLLRANDAQVLAAGTPVSFEEVTSVNEERSAFHSTKSPMRDGENKIIGVVGVSLDVSARRAAERALADSEAAFRQRLNALPQMVWSTLPDGYHDFYNDRWYEFTGAPPGTTDGEGWNSMFHPDDQPKAWERWRQSLESGQPYEIEYRLRHHEGDYRWVLGRALPIRDASGAIVRWMGTCTDVHEMVENRASLAENRKALQRAKSELKQRVAERTAELRRANEQLRDEIVRREATQAALVQSQKLEALGRLVSGVAHDFNNVIQAVAGGFSVVERRTDDPKLVDVARHGVNAAQRGGALVKQLLAFARQQVLEPRAVDLCELLAEAEPLLVRSAGTSVTVLVSCPLDMPRVRVDPVLLETALINLTVNARDAMPEGGTLAFEVQLTAAGEPDRPAEILGQEAVAIRIVDDGTGMSPDVLHRVVEPFFTTKGPGKGTGLGLAMVHGFAHQSGGALRIESQEGAGTTITLYLPVDRSAAVDKRVPTSKPRAAQPATLLLVDDDEAVRAVTAAQLSDLGHRVVDVAEAAAALRALDLHAIDVVVTDVVMPGVDGVALAQELRARQPALPVLFVTGHADRSKLEGEVILDKPFTVPALVEALDPLVAKARK